MYISTGTELHLVSIHHSSWSRDQYTIIYTYKESTCIYLTGTEHTISNQSIDGYQVKRSTSSISAVSSIDEKNKPLKFLERKKLQKKTSSTPTADSSPSSSCPISPLQKKSSENASIPTSAVENKDASQGGQKNDDEVYQNKRSSSNGHSENSSIPTSPAEDKDPSQGGQKNDDEVYQNKISSSTGPSQPIPVTSEGTNIQIGKSNILFFSYHIYYEFYYSMG
jgi:hypothetical protein